MNAERLVQAGSMIRDAGLFLSVTVLLGIAGVEDSQVHAIDTARALTGMAPNQIAALTLMILENTPLYQDCLNGDFKVPSLEILLGELKTMVQNINLDKVQFQANHASNYLPISGRLARDRQTILDKIDEALAGRQRLTPEFQRAL